MKKIFLIKISSEYPNFILQENFIKKVYYFMYRHFVYEKIHGILSIIFTSNILIKKIHSFFFQKFSITDVITFKYNNSRFSKILGEIIISIEFAFKQAKKLNLSFYEEIILYMIHGWLHIFNFKDISINDYLNMHREQAKILCIMKFYKIFTVF